MPLRYIIHSIRRLIKNPDATIYRSKVKRYCDYYDDINCKMLGTLNNKITQYKEELERLSYHINDYIEEYYNEDSQELIFKLITISNSIDGLIDNIDTQHKSYINRFDNYEGKIKELDCQYKKRIVAYLTPLLKYLENEI